MKLTWMLLVTIATSSTAFAALPISPDSLLFKKDHLVVIASEFPVSVKILRNATGHQIGLEGVSPLMLDWLSRRYKFKYSLMEVNATGLEDRGPQFPGLISYVLRGECDLIMTAMVQTSERLRSLEMVNPWFYTQAAFLIPIPEENKNNVNAVIKPFQFWVWIGLLAASVATILAVLSFNRVLKFKILSIMYQSEEMNQQGLRQVGVTENIFTYVITTLLNQAESIPVWSPCPLSFLSLFKKKMKERKKGRVTTPVYFAPSYIETGGYISCKITPIRLVIGSWCLLTLVLLNVYNGVLISYVTATHREPPLINSMNDVASDSNIRVIVNKGQGPDIVFSTATTGAYKVLGDKLRAYPMSRCNTTQQCVDLVKSLPAQHVFFSSDNALKTAIKDDYKKTNQCKITIAAAETASRAGGWGLAKKSPHLENFNRGTSELREIGLISLWMKQFEPNTKPCYYSENQNNRDRKTETRQRLSLTNLMGAFAVLAVGYLLSLLIFLAEVAFSHLKTNSVIVI